MATGVAPSGAPEYVSDRYTKGLAVFEEWQLHRYNRESYFAHPLRGVQLGIRYLTLPHYFGRVPPVRLWLRRFGGPRVLPDFACVGALKSGTTDLASYLMQHPSILAPLTKEIGHGYTQLWGPYFPTEREKAEVLRCTGRALAGYFDPALHDLLLIDNYRAVRPDAKILMMLRDPVERAYSHYKWDLFLSSNDGLRVMPYGKTYADYVGYALEMFPAPSPPTTLPSMPVLGTGVYVNAVARWLEAFGKDNVHIVTAEDFFADISKTVCGVHEFLGLPAVEPVHHHVLNRNPLEIPEPDADSVARLREFYRPWNEKLFEVIGCDLGWNDH
ncbi:sulfotransferase domain-containing protein [Nocardia sp. NPDC052112]|uniref:sulfotransferase family protein n=1 Tax=Nocardia sp. NPDC052112 TaxID=3155646 RepID=UPI003428B808